MRIFNFFKYFRCGYFIDCLTVHSFFDDTIPYYAAIIMYTKSLQTVQVHGTVSTNNRERNEISSLNFHRTIYGRFLGQLSYIEPPLPITSQVMDLRSSHCIIFHIHGNPRNVVLISWGMDWVRIGEDISMDTGSRPKIISPGL